MEDKDTIWLDQSTVMCSRCGVDSVIGDASGFPIHDKLFSELMDFIWFNGYARGHNDASDYYSLEETLTEHIVNDIC